MKLLTFLRLMARNWKWLLILPLLASVLVFLLVSTRDKQYSSSLEIYTGFASGYSISSNESQKMDYYAVNNAMDNLINTIRSAPVMQKVGLTLFAQSMIYGAQGDERYITKESYEKLMGIVPDDVKKLINKQSVDSTVSALERYMDKGSNNFVYELIHLYHPDFSLWALDKIKIARQGNSDLLELSYSCNDPALCYQTLAIVGREFIKYYRSFREVETIDVVKYFEAQLAASAVRLAQAEDKFMEYSKQNRVINYYEQTKAVAGQLQAFELDYDKILAMNAGAKSSVEELEGKIGLHARLLLKSQEVIAERNRIAERTAALTQQSVFLDDSSYVRFDNRSLDKAVNDGRSALRRTIDTMNLYANSPEGIEIDNILNQWLTKVVEYDASSAAIAVLDKRRMEIDKKFDFFAPVGATVKRDERSIDINEREYLSLLQSLALAKLRQQGIQMSSSTLRVVSDPVFPIQAESSKRKVLSLMAFVVVFILVLGVLLLVEFMDRTIRDAVRARRLTGLEVISLMPVNAAVIPSRIPDLDHLALSQLLSQVMRLKNEGKPCVINLLSMEHSEGKSYIAQLLADRFLQMGYAIRRVTAGEDFDFRNKRYAEAVSVLDLIPAGETRADIYLVELPAANLNVIPSTLLRTASINIMIVRANRPWRESDALLTGYISKQSDNPLYLVVNGAPSDALEGFMGELPKSRSRIRRGMKKIVTAEFTARETF